MARPLVTALLTLLLPVAAFGQDDDVLVPEDADEVEDVEDSGGSSVDAATLEKLSVMLAGSGSFRARATAAVALGRLGDSRGALALGSALDTDPHYAVRAAAATALGRLPTPAGVAALLRALDDPDPNVRESAAQGLAGFHKPAHLTSFAEAASADDARLRRAAANAYGDVLRSGHDAAAGVVLQALGDEDTQVRAIGERALKTLNHERALPVLLRGLDYVSATVRAESARMLGDRPDERAVAPLVTALSRTGEDADVLAAVRGALQKHADYIDRASVAAQARDGTLGDDDARLQAIRLVGALGDNGAENILKAALSDSSASVRATAARAAADLGAARAKSMLEGALAAERDPRVKKQVELVLRTLR